MISAYLGHTQQGMALYKTTISQRATDILLNSRAGLQLLMRQLSMPVIKELCMEEVKLLGSSTAPL
jgi:hypothetical protein